MVRKINTTSSKKITVQDRNHQITVLRVEYEFLMGHNPKALVLFMFYFQVTKLKHCNTI